MSGDSGPLTQADGLAFLQRTTDENWLKGMLAQPDGAAIIAAKLATFEAASESVTEQSDACTISTAPTGSPGRCDLSVQRIGGGGALTIPAGSKLVTSSKVELALALDVPVANGQVDILLPLQTLRLIDLINTMEPTFDDLLEPGDAIAPIVATDNDPAVIAMLGALTYASSTPTTGATMDWLSVLGEERGCYRQPGEDGEAYRLRVRTIPDAVTPIAVAEAIHGAQVQGKLPAVFMVEPYRDQASDEARAAINLIFADSVFADDGFCDDPLGVDVPGKLPFRTCETPSLREGRAYFRLSIPGPLRDPDGSILYCDDGFCDDPRWGYPDVTMHPKVQAALSGILDEARTKIAGGVQFDIYVGGAT